MFRELTEQVKHGKIGKINQLILQMPQEGLIKPPNIAGEKNHTEVALEDPKRRVCQSGFGCTCISFWENDNE